MLKRNQTPPAPSNQRGKLWYSYANMAPLCFLSVRLTDCVQLWKPAGDREVKRLQRGSFWTAVPQRSQTASCDDVPETEHTQDLLTIAAPHTPEEDPAEIVQSKHTWMFSTRFPKGPVLKLLLTNKHFHTRTKRDDRKRRSRWDHVHTSHHLCAHAINSISARSVTLANINIQQHNVVSCCLRGLTILK